jgi:hypothetical protein
MSLQMAETSPIVASALFESILSHFRVARRNGNQAQAQCPSHNDTVASLTISAGQKCVVVHDHGSCETDTVLAAVGLEMKDLYPPRDTVRPVRLVATYDYRDAGGNLVYQVLRWDPKKFSQRRPDGRGGWINDLKGVEPLLYRLPELIKAPIDEWTLSAEGEKDCDNLVNLGFTATTNSGGAGKFRAEFAPYFEGRKIAILRDNDEAGKVHARKIAALVASYAREVRIVEPSPATPVKGDVSDLIAKGWDREMILAMIERVPVYQIQTVRPILCEASDQYPVIAKATWKAISRINSPPYLFNYNGVPIRINADNQRQVLDTNSFRNELAEAGDFVNTKSDPKFPSADLANLMLAGRDIQLPKVKRFALCPFFSASGRLVSDLGYDRDSRVYLLATCEIDVPQHPDASDVRRAIDLIESAIVDFPFATRADRADFYALLIERLVREMIDGPLPGHLMEGSKPGSGKGLLAKVYFRIVGISPSAWTGANSRDEAEMRKAITTFLMTVIEILYIENLSKPLVSGTLASAMTEAFWLDRILGVNQQVELPIRNSWLVTANNPVLSTELLRRFCRIRLVPMTAHPEERTDFRHSDLLEWVQENRAALLSSALILVQSWIDAERPVPVALPSFGSFESWTKIIGSILKHAGIKGFLENRREIADQADAETAPFRVFVARWFERYGSDPTFARDLLEIAESVEDLTLGFKEDSVSNRSKVKSLGKLLNRNKDSVFGINRENNSSLELQVIRAGSSQGTIRWKLHDAAAPRATEPSGAEELL